MPPLLGEEGVVEDAQILIERRIHRDPNELEPAFCKATDYPPDWLVYHPVLGVVLKTTADVYGARDTDTGADAAAIILLNGEDEETAAENGGHESAESRSTTDAYDSGPNHLETPVGTGVDKSTTENEGNDSSGDENAASHHLDSTMTISIDKNDAETCGNDSAEHVTRTGLGQENNQATIENTINKRDGSPQFTIEPRLTHEDSERPVMLSITSDGVG
jgi:hypothetical protein